MGIFKRLEDIISANLNDMMDRNENPEPMLKQAIREMEAAIAEATQSTAKAMAHEKRIVTQLADGRKQIVQWQERAEAAVEADNDDQARKSLARRQEQEKLVTALEDQLEASSEAAQTLRHQLEGMKAKLAEAKRSLGVVAARHKAAVARKQEVTGLAKNDAFDRFDKISEKVEMAEAEADAMQELLGKPSRAARFEELETSSENLDVEDELAALKKKRK